jgi:flavin reductase (DIM6/NTAB) family NADH-FMN oxidoreductase RutF
MVYFDPEKQNRKENYKMLSGSVIPRPIAFVTSQNAEGVVNAAPFSFFNVVTAKPPLISICIGRRKGETSKDTAKNILENKQFVVHIVDPSYMEEMNQSAAEYPSHVSEVEETGLTTVESKRVKVPSIKEAKIRMECELFKSIPFGDDEEVTTDMIVGKVVMMYIEDEIYEDGKIIASKLSPVGRLAGSNYTELGDIISLSRPK